jgi:hypothetical protein
MDFLKNQFKFEDHNRRKGGWIFGQGDHDDHVEHHDGDHDDDHDDDHDEHRDNDHDEHPAVNHSQVYPLNPVMPPTGLSCTRCSTQLVQGAKFCHQCGMALEQKADCVSCGSRLPANSVYCPQCGDKNG